MLAEGIRADPEGNLFLVDAPDRVAAAVEAEGFVFDSDRREGDVLFSTYQKDGHVLLISYVPFEGATRVISEQNTVIPPRETEAKKLCTPLMTQIKTPYLVCDCGMSYLMRLCDGRFIMIDGGYAEYEETEYLLETIEKQNVLDGKPVIIHGDGTSLWTITHNSDFAKGFVGLMLNPHAMGEAFHITSDESVTWNQIYRIIADELNVPFKPYYVPSDFLDKAGKYDYEGGLIGDKANTVVFDNSKVKRAVPDFVCTVRADQGLRKTVRHMLATPELQVEDPEFDAWCDKVIAAMEKAKEDILNG